jgi:hypothetical protein
MDTALVFPFPVYIILKALKHETKQKEKMKLKKINPLKYSKGFGLELVTTLEHL